MEAKELRIGNLFNPISGNFKYNNPLTKVTCKVVSVRELVCTAIILDEELKDTHGLFNFLLTNMSPIPLTEEWLVRLGFKKEVAKHAVFYLIALKKINGQTLKGLCLYYEESTKSWNVCFTDYYTGTEKTEMFPYDIKYVNQLQNLYFALTGEELTTEQPCSQN